MNAEAILEDLRCRHVSLEVEEDNLRVGAPVGAITEEIRAALVSHKQRLIELLTWEKRKLEDAGRRGFVAGWSRYPGWISLHDPTTGDWHDFPAADCFPSIVAEADKCDRKGGAV
jgi:hypothetical protein